MFTILLTPGDYMWTESGTHHCDDYGCVCIVKEPTIYR